MARKTDTSAVTEALEEFESLADRGATWVGDHAREVVGGILALLVGIGAFEGYRTWDESKAEAASTALARVETAYLQAMGAEAGATELPELANPELRRGVQTEYVGRFSEVATEHAGRIEAALAWVEVAKLREALGEPAAADEALDQAVASLDPASALAGTVLGRIAARQEDRGDWAAAAATHERAGGIEAFPLRYFALADAARCYDQAGDGARALALLQQIETEATSFEVPAYLRGRQRELEAAASS